MDDDTNQDGERDDLEAVARTIEALSDPLARLEEPFLSVYFSWISGAGAPVTDPGKLLQTEGEPFADALKCQIIREHYIARIGHAVPTENFISVFKSLPPVLEIGAGRGYLSKILRQAGIDAVATDPDPRPMDPVYTLPSERQKGDTDLVSCKVEMLDALGALSAYPGRTILCSWPAYETSWLTRAVEAMTPGQVLAYVGEGPGGLNADESFFRAIETGQLIEHPDQNLQNLASEAIWSFPSINDSLRLLVRQ